MGSEMCIRDRTWDVWSLSSGPQLLENVADVTSEQSDQHSEGRAWTLLKECWSVCSTLVIDFVTFRWDLVAASLCNGLGSYFLGNTWITLKTWLPGRTVCGWFVVICLISTLVDRVLTGLAPFVTLGMVLWGYLTLLVGIIIDTGMSLGFDDKATPIKLYGPGANRKKANNEITEEKKLANGVYPQVVFIAEGEVAVARLQGGSGAPAQAGTYVCLSTVTSCTSDELKERINTAETKKRKVHFCNDEPPCTSKADVLVHSDAWGFVPADYGDIDATKHYIAHWASRFACGARGRRVLRGIVCLGYLIDFLAFCGRCFLWLGRGIKACAEGTCTCCGR